MERRVAGSKEVKESTGLGRRTPDVNNGWIDARGNDQFIHITVPPSMKEDIAKQKSRLDEQGLQHQLQELTFPSAMDHLKEENKRLSAELQQVKQGDGQIAAQLLTNMDEMRKIRSQLREAEKKIRHLEAEKNRMQHSIGSEARSDHEIERLRDDIQRWKTEAERWKIEAGRWKVDAELLQMQERPRGSHSAGYAISQTHGQNGRGSEAFFRNCIQQLEQELNETKRVNTELSGANKDWESQYNRMKTDYEAQLNQLKESVRDMQNQMLKVLENSEDEKKQHEERVRKLQDQITATQQRANQIESKKCGVASEYDQLLKEYRTTERKLTETSAQLSDEQREKETLRVEIISLQNQLHRQQSFHPEDVESLKDQNHFFRQQHESDQQNKAALERQVAQLREAIQMTEANRDRYQQNDELEALKAQLDVYRNGYEDEKREKERLQRELQASRSQQSTRNHHQTDEIEALREQNRIFCADFEREKEEKERYKTQLSEKQRCLQSLSTTNAALQEQVTQCRDDFERERRDKEDYLRQLRRERSTSGGQHQLVSSQQPLSTVDQFGGAMIEEQRQAWERLRRSQGGVPHDQAVNPPHPQPNIIDGSQP